MMRMLSDEIEKVTIDEKIESKIKKFVINCERENLKTNEKNNLDMINLLKKGIENIINQG